MDQVIHSLHSEAGAYSLDHLCLLVTFRVSPLLPFKGEIFEMLFWIRNFLEKENVIGTIIAFNKVGLLGSPHESYEKESGFQTWEQLQSSCFMDGSWCSEFVLLAQSHGGRWLEQGILKQSEVFFCPHPVPFPSPNYVLYGRPGGSVCLCLGCI